MIYQERMRRVDDQLFTAADFPDCGQVRAETRVDDTVASTQSMNSESVIEQSRRIAARAEARSEPNRILCSGSMFHLILGREPGTQEREACLARIT